MKHIGIHMPQSIDTPPLFMNIAEIMCAPMSMRAPPIANAMAIHMTVRLERFANTSIVS